MAPSLSFIAFQHPVTEFLTLLHFGFASLCFQSLFWHCVRAPHDITTNDASSAHSNNQSPYQSINLNCTPLNPKQKHLKALCLTPAGPTRAACEVQKWPGHTPTFFFHLIKLNSIHLLSLYGKQTKFGYLQCSTIHTQKTQDQWNNTQHKQTNKHV